MKIRVNHEIHQALKEYLSFTEVLAAIVPDPSFDGVYAVQVTVPEDKHAGVPQREIQFLLTRQPRTTFGLKEQEYPYEIEEVEFSAWPPRQRP